MACFDLSVHGLSKCKPSYLQCTAGKQGALQLINELIGPNDRYSVPSDSIGPRRIHAKAVPNRDPESLHSGQ
jgi:hypothetical protein